MLTLISHPGLSIDVYTETDCPALIVVAFTGVQAWPAYLTVFDWPVCRAYIAPESRGRGGGAKSWR